MIKAAGIMYLTPDRQALFLKRGAGSDHPMEWAWPGGQLEDDETTEQAALRESEEECGYAPAPAALLPHARAVAPADVPDGEDVDFTTFLCRVPEPFTVTLCDEHTGYAWANIDAPPLPLHPGAQLAIDRLGMNELGVARAMAAGQLASPQRYENVWLFNIRISGTGTSYRPTIKEFVSRPPEVWLSEEMIARCNGLACIWEHPDKSLLTSDEFSERAIGSVFLPYVRTAEAELWAVVKVYDDEAADEMAHSGLSTSPAVNFKPGANRKIMVEGRRVLLETDPSLVDHIAICGKGVWDKGEEPSGVESVLADSAVVTACGAERTSWAILGPAVAAFRLNVASRAAARHQQ